MLNVIVDSQFVEAISTCEQKYEYDFIYHYQHSITPRKLEMGSFVHDLFDIYYTNFEDGHDEAIRLMNLQVESLIHRYALNGVDVETVVSSANGSLEFFKHQPIKVKSVETPITRLLHEEEGLRIAYVSKIDLVIDGPNFENMPVDHKTEHGRRYEPNPMQNQFIGYAWATNSPRIMINKVGFQTSLKDIEKYRRSILFYTDSQKEEWRVNTVGFVKKMLEIQNGRRPLMNRSSCDKFNGCKYLDICKSSPENRKSQLEIMFRSGEPWTPLRD